MIKITNFFYKDDQDKRKKSNQEREVEKRGGSMQACRVYFNLHGPNLSSF